MDDDPRRANHEPDHATPARSQRQTSAIGWSGGSLQIGRWFGIPVFLHWSFLALFALIVGLPWWFGQAADDVLVSGLQFAGLFLCVALHEFGHALAARRYGIATRDIILLPIGGVARLERLPRAPLQEIVIALAGPAVNVVIAAVLLAVSLAFEAGWIGLSSSSESLLSTLLFANVVLVVFNLLPAFPMDGGRVLRAILAWWMEFPSATLVAVRVGQVLGVVMAGAAVVAGVPLLIITALFLWMAGEAELAAIRQEARMNDLKARWAMTNEWVRQRGFPPLARIALGPSVSGTTSPDDIRAGGVSPSATVQPVVVTRVSPVAAARPAVILQATVVLRPHVQYVMARRVNPSPDSPR